MWKQLLKQITVDLKHIPSIINTCIKDHEQQWWMTNICTQ